MPSDTLRKLGEALLNATLMLIALILLLAVMIVVQLRGLGSDLRGDLAGFQARSAEAREQAQNALAALDAARIARGEALPDEITRAREGLATALQGWEETPDPTNAERAVWQRMLMAAVAAAAREMQTARAAP